MPGDPHPEAGMADQASDFIRQSQAMAEQSWSQWMRYLQQAAGQPASPLAGFGMPGMAGMAGMPGMAAPGAPMGDMLERSLAGIAPYLEWMQRAASAQATVPGTDWQAAMKELFGAAGQPFTQAFGGIDSTAAQGFVQQWQAWLEAAGQAGMTDWLTPPHLPGFGLHREHHAKQQSLMAAMMESAAQQRRYQALILKANTQGLERLQDKLADHVEPGRQLDSLKALYDLWVDAAEEAYAEIALSDEFREVYGAMVNAQMLERQLMQQQLEELCRQLGLPTRSEVDSLGRRLQEVRREQRAAGRGGADEEFSALRAELAALKKQLAGAGISARSAAPEIAARPTAGAKSPAPKAAATIATAKKATPTAATATRKRSSAKASRPAAKSVAKSVAKSSGKAGSRVKMKAAAATATASASKAGASVRPGIPAPRRAKRK
jgi:class III poly(R)-hydroxyalkanoic acid synthase PhaE subunit